MKNKKLFLRITAFIIVLFTVILIGKINSNASQQKGPKISYNTYYTTDNEKLVNNKIWAVFCNLIYDEKGNVDEYLYNNYKTRYSATAISLYIDDNEEPYKKYEIPTEFFLSYENSGTIEKVYSGFSCYPTNRLVCDNKYEFDLTGIEIKESFKIVFSWERSIYSEGYINKFYAYTENGEIIITQERWNAYFGDYYTEEI